MNRREFLKRAGIGTAAAASWGLLASPAALADDEGDEEEAALRSDERGALSRESSRFFAVVAISKAMTIEGVDHRLAFNGCGRFNADRGRVRGRGSFVHFNNATPGTPKEIFAFGRWKATDFVNYTAGFGTFGIIEASILEALVRLRPDGGAPIPDVPLELICNIGPAGITTGKDEGIVLSIPGAPFGAFAPQVPPAGLTHISIPGG